MAPFPYPDRRPLAYPRCILPLLLGPLRNALKRNLRIHYHHKPSFLGILTTSASSIPFSLLPSSFFLPFPFPFPFLSSFPLPFRLPPSSSLVLPSTFPLLPLIFPSLRLSLRRTRHLLVRILHNPCSPKEDCLTCPPCIPPLLCHTPWERERSVEYGEGDIQEETGATIRCFPFDQPEGPHTCLMTGEPAAEVCIFAKSY